MKTVLCFGDSNTWGYDPPPKTASPDVRWTGILTGLLGPTYQVIEEGLNGARPCGMTPSKATRTGATT